MPNEKQDNRDVTDALESLSGGPAPQTRVPTGSSRGGADASEAGSRRAAVAGKVEPQAEPGRGRPTPGDLPLCAGEAPGSTQTARTSNGEGQALRDSRCLYCGYPLMEESEFRCSECGRGHARPVLERWFSGPERNRLERVLWLVRACAFLKLWVVPDLRELAFAASGAAAGWACWLAGKGKQGTVGWHYAVSGVIVAAIMVLAPTVARESTVTMSTLDIVCACLLLITMLRDASGLALWREPQGSRIALGIILAAPAFALGARWLEIWLGSRPGILSGSMPSVLLSYVLYLAPQACALAVWVFVWRWLAGLKRAMFGGEVRR